MQQEFFSLLLVISRNFNDRLSSNFHRFVFVCICWDTQSEITGLWQLSIVSSALNCTSTKPRWYHWCVVGDSWRGLSTLFSLSVLFYDASPSLLQLPAWTLCCRRSVTLQNEKWCRHLKQKTVRFKLIGQSLWSSWCTGVQGYHKELRLILSRVRRRNSS